MATLSPWAQRFLDANGRLPEHMTNPPGSGATARAPALRQGQASLSNERQRYLVQPGVKGHTEYIIWDTANNIPVATYISRMDAINAAIQLNVSPTTNP